MLLTKFQNILPIGSGLKDFCRFLAYYVFGHGGHFGHAT